MVERATKEENALRKGSQFISEVSRERYFDEKSGLHGIYTEKVYNVRSLLPTFIKVFVPASSSLLIEKVGYSSISIRGSSYLNDVKLTR